jgi:DNA-binding transcriptional regulator YhcF (GntR family)
LAAPHDVDALAIDAASAIPPFEQVRQQILERVQSGALPAGAKLPTVRRLAEDLGLAVNTVARAYRELESDGFIETRGRAGSFVSAQGGAAERRGQDLAHAYAKQVRHLGLDPADALRWVAAALRAD